MNRLSSALQTLRLSRGLFWKTTRPPVPWTSFFTVIACTLTYVTVAYVDDLEHRALVMEQVLTIYEPIVQTFQRCETGAIGYSYPDGRTFECSKPL